MLTEVFKYILEHSATIAFIIVLIGCAIWVTFKLTRMLNRFVNIENQCKNCKDETVPNLNDRLIKIDSSLFGIFQSINALTVYLKGKDASMDISLFKAQSPIQLTDLGTKILYEIGGHKVIDDNLDIFISDMEKQDFKSGLDVQNYSSALILNSFSNEIFTPVKDYIFKNPVYKYNPGEGKEAQIPLDLGTVNQVIGIYLRDKYFEKHPELNK